MADGRAVRSSIVTNKISRPVSGEKSACNNREKRQSVDILSKEEEYKRLNEELEKKTASLIRDAEEVMREQANILSTSRLLDNINTEEFLKEFDDDITLPNEIAGNQLSPSQAAKLTSRSRPHSRPKPSIPAKSRTKSSKSNNADNVAVPDETFLTEYKELSLQQTIAKVEARTDGSIDSSIQDDILPQAATDMGSEATIRFLKAKLRVMQEELDRLAQEASKKEEENTVQRQRVKELEEERAKLSRTNAAQQTQVDKLKKMSDDSQSKLDSSESQVAALKREIETLRRNEKKHSTSQSVVEVRLNRALEEVEKYKEQLQRTKSVTKEVTEGDKRRLDQLMLDNKRLEKQKNELMAGFKKQLKLIDILKRQRMHIEAAKMLQFSEEEFVKALEWGN